jgi:iron complex outermembrane recepter protein
VGDFRSILPESRCAMRAENRTSVAARRACRWFGIVASIAVPYPAFAQATAPAAASASPTTSALASPPTSAASSATTVELPQVEVVGVTPVLGTGVPLNQVPSNVQTLTAPQIQSYHPWALPQALENNIGGVSLSDTEGNPFETDLDFHGYTASPVLGTPQGLAVYQNGTRINEPFGDVLYWDYVPLWAIEKLQLIPGSNPVYGLNALGGAVTLQMKSGFDFQGLSSDLSAGSFDRQQGIVQYGVEKGDVAFYTGLMAANDGGWRLYSPSQVFQSYSDLELKKGPLDLGASFTFANNYLSANGATPEQMIDLNRGAAFAIPDTEHDNIAFVQTRGNYEINSALSVQGNAYFRKDEEYVLNGAASGFGACQPPGNPAYLCNNPGPGQNVLRYLYDGIIPASIGIGGGGIIPTTDTRTTGYGGSLQTTLKDTLFGLKNIAIIGTSIDDANSHFYEMNELGTLVYLSPTSPPTGTTTIPNGLWVGGLPFNVILDSHNRYYGVYGNDTLSLTPSLSATLAGRLNMADVQLIDLYGTSLDSTNEYTHFNPSAGLAWQVNPGLNLFGNYSVSNRVPTPAELGCANPVLPCRFPLGFVSDPPLQQVIANTIEFGARGHAAPLVAGDPLSLDWSVDVYGAKNENDIIYVTTGPLLGAGYFANAGQTQRVGTDLTLKATWRKLECKISYGLVRATYQSNLMFPSQYNPGANADGFITVTPGDRLPDIPVNSAKLDVRYRWTDNFSTDLEAIIASNVILEGDEANLQKPVPGYIVLNAEADYELGKQVELYAQLENLTNNQYATFGIYGDPTGDGAFPQYTNTRFLTPAQPFGFWIGIRTRI